ncbi:MAG: hypothetical protein O7G88_21325 [bacterium]|nr:hypothetical protein [bacterium]
MPSCESGWMGPTLAWRVSVLLTLVGVVTVFPCQAHHGGLGIEGDLVEWALKIDQWQAEVLDQGHRIKFLSYPRQPILASRTRLVFEIQSAVSGQYVGGLSPRLIVQPPNGTAQTIALQETKGVTAYYETAVTFAQEGEHTITFHSSAAGTELTGRFYKTVHASALIGDWTIWLGHLVVAAAFAVTWIGLVLSIQRRFVLPR